MRQLFLFFVLILTSATSMQAQSSKGKSLNDVTQDYYSGKTIAKGNSIEYRIVSHSFDFNHFFDRLGMANINNHLYRTPPFNRSTGEKIGRDQIPPVKCNETAVIKIFSEELKDVSFGSLLFQEGKLRVFTCFDTDSGVVNEIEFTLYPDGENKVLYCIPPTVFERIEMRLKRELKYTVEERFRYPSYYTDAFFVMVSNDKIIRVVQ